MNDLCGVKESDTGLAPPSRWDLVSDKQMMQEEQPLQACGGVMRASWLSAFSSFFQSFLFFGGGQRPLQARARSPPPEGSVICLFGRGEGVVWARARPVFLPFPSPCSSPHPNNNAHPPTKKQQVARCTKIINPNTDEAKYVINVKQIAKFVVALGDKVRGWGGGRGGRRLGGGFGGSLGFWRGLGGCWESLQGLEVGMF